jgi:uncharacterized protein YprB with RNaseH-like and TPR domain
LSKKNPKVLIWDLETNGVNALKSSLSFIVLFGYKWLGEKEVHTLRFDDYGGYTNKGSGYTDKFLLRAATKIMAEADLMVAHYGDRFDRPFVNGRLAINELPPIPTTKQLDTCLLAWKQFNFHSNRLKELAKFLGCKEKKDENQFPLWWLQVMRGGAMGKKALDLMEEYNMQDVRTLEEIYLRLRPFEVKPVKLYSKGCRICGAPVKYDGTYTRTKEKVYKKFKCTNKVCGYWDRDTKAVKEV